MTSPSQPSEPIAPPLGNQAKPISRERMALLFMVMLVTAAGNTAMQSVMPSIGTALKVNDVWISFAYSWSALLWVIMAPFWAKRSDRRGRKAMMALGLVGFITSLALCGLLLWLGLYGWLSATATLFLFAAARSLYGGFGSASPPAVQAYVASRTPRSQRTQAMALIASSFGLGTVIGPALAPLLVFQPMGLVGPFMIFAAFGALVLVALRLRLPGDDPTYAARSDIVGAPYSASAASRYSADELTSEGSDEDEPTLAKPGPVPSEPEQAIPDLKWLDRRLRPWLVAGLVGGHAQAMILGISGFLVLDRLGLRGDPDGGTGPIGLVLMSGALATLLAQWGIIPSLKLGPRSSTLWGMALAVFGIGMLAFAQDLHTIALGFSVASLGFGLYRPGFTAGTSLAVTRAEQGQVSGIVASVNGAAYIVGPAFGVWLYGHHANIGFGIIAGLCVLVYILGWRSLDTDEVLEARRD